MESCQLTRDQAMLAMEREYDEPFLIEEPQRAGALLGRIEQRGKGWTKGGRFYHITGKQDKAKAASLLPPS
jgi:mannosyl-3-phosphoglycerate phosphatase